MTVVAKLSGPSPDSASSIITYAVTTPGNEPVTAEWCEAATKTCHQALVLFWASYATPGWRYRGVETKGYDGNTNVVGNWETNVSIVGPNNVPVMPPGACYLVHKRAEPGQNKRARGRWHFPIVAEAAVGDDGKLTVAGQQALNGLYQALINNHMSPAVANTANGVICQPVIRYKASKDALSYSQRPIATVEVDDDIHWFRGRSRY